MAWSNYMVRADETVLMEEHWSILHMSEIMLQPSEPTNGI
jgi:hypothetical protein